MAAAAAASVAVRYLNDITECPICAQELTEARVLPCIHTFCLKCLQQYTNSTKPTDKLSCPLCRQRCSIPKDGLQKLPRNYFVEKVLQVKKLAHLMSISVVCDLCTENRDATIFCINCKKNMCSGCFDYHKKFKANASHKVIGLDEQLKTEDLLVKLPEKSCEKHSEESIKLYCFECKLAVCMMCFVEEHSSHKCSDVKMVADDLRKLLDADIAALRETDDGYSKFMRQLETNKEELTNKTGNAKGAISTNARKLQKMVDTAEQEMLAQLSDAEKHCYKVIESIREEAELRSAMIRNFIQYAKELKEKGTACDIAVLASPLHARAEELTKFCPDSKYNVTVKCNATNSSRGKVKEMIGKVDVEGL